jgi:hypothetical protein
MVSGQDAMCEETTFTTLSSIVLDELRFPGKEPLTDVVGGPGAHG